jgi:hypothetical protein
MRFAVPIAGHDFGASKIMPFGTMPELGCPQRNETDSGPYPGCKAPPDHRDSARTGGLEHILPILGKPMRLSHRILRRRLAASEGEVYLNLRIDFDRLSVQQVRLVLPLLHGFDRCRSQHRVPADQLQVFDVTCLADLRL